jgi:uncharacterized membrane protein
MRPSKFHDHLDDNRVVQAIVDAEKKTSGEIRVFVTRHRCDDAVAAARREFGKLGMTKTPHRNAVLLYFAPRSQKFAIVGDEGIHERCGEVFWQDVAQAMESLLRSGKFTEAVTAGIARAGTELAQHFPQTSRDQDDLPNAVVRD